MLKKIFSSSTTSITVAAVIIGASSFFSRVLGMVRDRLIASHFGIGAELDAYYSAFRIPDTIFVLLIVGALSAAFIPIATKLLEGTKSDAWNFASSILNSLILILVLVSVFLFIFTPQLMRVLTPGFDNQTLDMSINLMRIMLLSPLIMGVSSVLGNLLQSAKMFFVNSISPILYNLGIIFGLFFFVPYLGIYGLAWGVILGASLHLIINIPSLISIGYKYSFSIKFNQHTKEAFLAMIPRALSLGASQIIFMVLLGFVSSLAQGNISMINYAFNITSLPVGIFGVSFALAAFPSFCEYVNKDRIDELKKSFVSTIKQIIFFIIPLSALFIALRAQVVRVVLGGGLFDWSDTIQTAELLAIFSGFMIFYSIFPLLIRMFLAFKKAIIPLYVTLVGLVVTIALSWLAVYSPDVMRFWFLKGSSGVVFAHGLGVMLQVLILWIILRIKLSGLYEKDIFINFIKVFISTVLMIVVVQYMKYLVAPVFGTTTFLGVFLQGFLSGSTGLIIFLSVGYLLSIEEIQWFMSSVKNKFKIGKRVEFEVSESIHEANEELS